MPLLRLAGREARIVRLAIAYHLGRPGSETDAVTLRPHRQGLTPVHEALSSYDASTPNAVELELSDYQLSRLGEALLGVVNELKQLELAEGRSAVPGFAAAVAELLPPPGNDAPGTALELVGETMMLRRRLNDAVREAEHSVAAARHQQATQAKEDRKPWWKLWRR